MNKEPHYIWIDEFIENVKPFIYVRSEDNLLIKRPNMVTKINKTGTYVLKFLLSGRGIEQLLNKVGVDKLPDIERFLLAVKRYLEGNLDEFDQSAAIEQEYFRMNYTRLPVLSELALTYKCNLRCKFCYAGCNCTTNPAKTDDELTADGFKKIIDKIVFQAKVPSISFTGGEPTLNKELLLELVSYAKKKDMRVNLITNGTLIDLPYVRALKKAGLDSAQVSIEGTSPNTHNRLTGRRGSFEKSIVSLGFFRQYDIYVHSNTTLNKLNAQECIDFPSFARHVLELDRFSMNLLIPTGSSVINKQLAVPYSQAGELITQIQEQSKLEQIEFMWYSPLPMCIFNTITHDLGNKGCAACDGLLSVAPNGDILPCASYDQTVGNLHKKTFSSIWKSKNAKFYRTKKFAHELCNKCEHFEICNGACPLYWRHQGYNELFEATKKNYETDHV